MKLSRYCRNVQPLLALLVASAFMVGCLNEHEDRTDNGPRTGQLTLIGIKGLSYETPNHSGTTDEKGRFQYYPGERITFRLGNLVLAEDVPAREFLTPMEFTADQRHALRVGGVDEHGMTSHVTVEEELATFNREAVNITRLLMVLDQDRGATSGKSIHITQRTIDQINEYLAEHPDFDPGFSDSIIAFARGSAEKEYGQETTFSEINKLVRSICFREEGHELCEEPPSQEEIDNAPEKPEDRDDWDDEVTYKEDLEALAKAIEDAKREVGAVNTSHAKEFLLREAHNYRLNLEEPYYLVPDTVEISQHDKSLKQLKLLKAGGPVQLADLEAMSKNNGAVFVHNYNYQTGEVRFFATSGAEKDDEATLLINFKRAGDYRWYRKPVLVRIVD